MRASEQNLAKEKTIFPGPRRHCGCVTWGTQDPCPCNTRVSGDSLGRDRAQPNPSFSVFDNAKVPPILKGTRSNISDGCCFQFIAHIPDPGLKINTTVLTLLTPSPRGPRKNFFSQKNWLCGDYYAGGLLYAECLDFNNFQVFIIAQSHSPRSLR